MLQPEILTKELAIPAFFRLAFRPFFLLPAVLCVIAVLAWIAILNGALIWQGHIAVTNWHGHEMVFGFAATVVIGFLLTAAQTWTGIRSINGRGLALLIVLWLVARIAFISNNSALLIAGIFAELVWWLISIAYLAYMLVKSNSRNNLIFIPLLTMLSMLDAVILIESLMNNVPLVSHLSYVAVLLITTVVTILGGRVIPFFTSRALNLPAIVARPRIETALIALIVATIICFFSSYWLAYPPILAVLFTLTGLGQLLRISHWRTKATLEVPLLWSLHFAYLAMGIGYIALGVSYISNSVSFSSAIHIITLGTIGSMILAMMSRVSLGHTARTLQNNNWVSLSFALLIGAALIRFLFSLFHWHSLGYLYSGIGWAVAFSIFIVYYGPILLKSRTDGRSG